MADLLTLLGILLFALTLPLVIELLFTTIAALFFRKEEMYAASRPDIAVIIAAHNEEQLIGRTLASVQAAETANIHVRIHVIAHNCSDNTAQIARTAGAEVTELTGPAGKGHALQHAFALLRPSCGAFLILDADTVIAPDLIGRVSSALTQHHAVQCRYEAMEAPGSGAQLAALAFRAMNVVRPRGRARLGLSCGILGNGFAFRSSLLDSVPYNAYSIVEDVEFHLAIVRAGMRVHYLDRARLFGEVAGTRSQHARWEGGRLSLARQKLPYLLSRILRGRKRFIEPALDLASLPLAQAIVLLLIAVPLPLMWLNVYALTALIIIALHVAVATSLGPSPLATLGALLLAPVYIVRKIFATKATLRSSKQNAAWIPTERTDAERETRDEP